MTNRILLFIAVCLALPAFCAADVTVGPAEGGGYVASTRQLIRPSGQTVEFGGRPVDMVLSPDGRTVYVMTNSAVVAIRTADWTILQQMGFDHASASYHGMAITRDGCKLYVSTSASNVLELLVAPDGSLSPGRRIAIPGPGEIPLSADEQIAQSTGKAAARPVIGGNPVPCGIALSPGEGIAYVCLSRSNALCALDLASGRPIRQIPVGVAPFDVAVAPDGMTAWVSNWGGRMPCEGERTEMSAGTPILVDGDSTAASGTVSLVDLRAGKEIAQVEVGLHPCELALDAARNLLYVANANSDSVSVIDTSARKVTRTIEVKPDDSLPFGSAPNALALNGNALYVANGGNNAVAVVDSAVRGFIPTAWYPGALATDGTSLYIANVKGYGSRRPGSKKAGDGGVAWDVHAGLGVVQKVALPGGRALGSYTKQVREDSRVPQVLLAIEKAQSGVKPVRRAAEGGRAVPDRACRLHHQGEQDLRSGSRRHVARQQRPHTVHLRQRHHAQPARAGR